MKRETIIRVITVSLVLLFSYAAISRLINYNSGQFPETQPAVSSSLSHKMIWIIALAELLVAALLLYPLTRLPGLFCSLFLLGFLTIYLLGSIYYSERLPGTAAIIWEGLSRNAHILLNLLFIILSGVAVVLSGGSTKTASG